LIVYIFVEGTDVLFINSYITLVVISSYLFLTASTAAALFEYALMGKA